MKLIKNGKFYIVVEIENKIKEYNYKIKKKDSFWNNRRWRINNIRKSK